jgi:hypothetical protein
MSIITEILSQSPRIRKDYKEQIIEKLSRKQAEEGGDRKFFNQYWQPFAWAAFIGFKNNRPVPITDKVDSDVFKYSVINNQAPDILKSLIVMAIGKLDDEIENNKEFLKDINVILKIIDEHANGGFEIINRKLNKNVDYFYEHNVFIEDLLKESLE